MTLWIFHIYVATFHQHLQMEYTSPSWSDVRFNQDHLYELCYPLSCLYWTGPYLPSWTFVSNSSVNGAPVAQALVSNVNHCLPFVLCLSLSLWFVSFGMLVLVTQMLSSDFPYAYWVSNCHCLLHGFYILQLFVF